jgi:hypothetical protein
MCSLENARPPEEKRCDLCGEIRDSTKIICGGPVVKVCDICADTVILFERNKQIVRGTEEIIDKWREAKRIHRHQFYKFGKSK